MITGELKNKVDKLWEIFWTGGLTNLLDVIEQITYLMFIRDLDAAGQCYAAGFTRKPSGEVVHKGYRLLRRG